MSTHCAAETHSSERPARIPAPSDAPEQAHEGTNEHAWFSLLVVGKEKGRLVNGSWLQNHFGTLPSATAWAQATSDSNSGLRIAVVDELGGFEYHFSDLTARAVVGKART